MSGRCRVELMFCFYSNGDSIVLNKQQGYLLRTKKLGVDEGGVATGYSVLDSPFMVESWPLAQKSTGINPE